MKGQAVFENVLIYVVVFAVFLIGFLPLLTTLVADAKVVADSTTDIFLTMIIPFVLIIMIIAFFMRVRGEKPMGTW